MPHELTKQSTEAYNPRSSVCRDPEAGGAFLWTFEDNERAANTRAGEIVVGPALGRIPKKVPETGVYSVAVITETSVGFCEGVGLEIIL